MPRVLFLAAAICGLPLALSAQVLDVPVREHAGDGQAATCGVSEVSGLRADGDGFLSVRTGPDAQYRKIGELHNGDQVNVFARQGDWVGILMPGGQVDQPDVCGQNGPERELTGQGLGWVHGNWLTYLYP